MKICKLSVLIFSRYTKVSKILEIYVSILKIMVQMKIDVEFKTNSFCHNYLYRYLPHNVTVNKKSCLIDVLNYFNHLYKPSSTRNRFLNEMTYHSS